MTPMLVFLGVPPAVAVAIMSVHVQASSTSSVAAYGRRGALDVPWGWCWRLGRGRRCRVVQIAAPAGQADLVVAVSYLVFLAETSVQVSSGFKGARIVLYGAVFEPGVRPGEVPGDVVVIVRGPQQPVRIARNQRVAGLWLNSHPVMFNGAPVFYVAASSRPVTEIAPFGTLRRLGAGVDHLAINAPAEQQTETRFGIRDMLVSRLGTDYYAGLRAVVRLKTNAGLYDQDNEGVRFVDRGLFRAEIALATDAPTGFYEADIVLFQDGTLVLAPGPHPGGAQGWD